jgi:hypothetical protein
MLSPSEGLLARLAIARRGSVIRYSLTSRFCKGNGKWYGVNLDYHTEADGSSRWSDIPMQ